MIEHNCETREPKNKITVMDQTDPSLVPDDIVAVAVAADDDVEQQTSTQVSLVHTHTQRHTPLNTQYVQNLQSRRIRR